MPLFGPNIQKMKTNRDVVGLTNQLTNKNLAMRLEVVNAFGDLHDLRGLLEASKNDNETVQGKSVSIIRDIRTPAAAGGFAQSLLQEKSQTFRREAFQLLKEAWPKNDTRWESLAIELLRTDELQLAGECFTQFDSLEVLVLHKEHKVRLRAIKSLQISGDDRASAILSKVVANMIRFGDYEDRIEALTILRGKGSKFASRAISLGRFGGDEARSNEVLSWKSQPLEIEEFTDVISELLDQEPKHLGDACVQTLGHLIKNEMECVGQDTVVDLLTSAENIWSHVRQNILDAGVDDKQWGVGAGLLITLRQEVIGALASYKDVPGAIETVHLIWEGKLLSFGNDFMDSSVEWECLCALAALEDESIKERLEYMHTRGHKYAKYAEAAIKLFGRPYQEIVAAAT